MTGRVRMTGQERREQLLTVGRSVFAEKGYDGASIEEIAQRAGITKPVVYEHFGSKEELYVVIVDREVKRLLGRFENALEAGSPRAKIEAAAHTFLTYIEEEQEGFRILVRDSPVTSGTGTLASVIGDVAAKVEYIFADEFRTRGFDAKLAPIYSQALVGMVALVGQGWLETGKPDRKVVTAHLVNLAWNGLKDLEKKPKP